VKGVKVALFLLFVGLPSGLLVYAMVIAADLWSKITTGDDTTDSLKAPVLYGVLRALRPVTPAGFAQTTFTARALMAIAFAEQSFGGAVGDSDPTAAPDGPSISPWQIERSNAIAEGFYSVPDGATAGDATDRAAYAAITTTGSAVFTWAYYAARFFTDNVWPIVSSAPDLTTALEVWNGGPNEGPSGSHPGANANYVTDAHGSQSASSIISGWS
jgi:hypothetical protein